MSPSSKGIFPNHRSYVMALGGICTALSTVSLFLASIVPGMELTLYALSSLFIAIVTAETGIKGGLISYGATALLGAILMPGKLGILPFLVLFGIYPVIKELAERRDPLWKQIFIKLAFYIPVIAICYGLFRSLFFSGIHLPAVGNVGLAIYALIMFALYDVILSGAIRLYRHRIKREQEIKLS